jgi:SPP1 gp7 family putative phage head morphogenesis protein
MAARYASLPFAEQIRFFRRKLNLGTRAWTDIWQAQHDHAFVVAGAMKDDLLKDLREAVDRVISEGITLQQFKKDFLSVVSKNGWSGWTGEETPAGRAWRARTIYDTNLRTSYAAGRYEQMQAIKSRRPYWRYRHNDSVVTPRPEHLAWDGLVLPADDPWWRTHFPPNGWGCKCYVETLSESDLARLDQDGPDQAPPIEWEEATVGTRGPTRRTVRTPKGIDPGFGYTPGEAQRQARSEIA